jgi:alanine-glyoxylate transaminase / serine-glyoxylate transaminase / serine-pyruvate transaminase
MTDRTLLMIPGPIEIEPDVLRALGTRTVSHLDPGFIRAFGRALIRLRDVFLAPDGQPFVVAGSGTLAMEMGVANLVEPGDRALSIVTGYFSDRMTKILARHGAEVTEVRAAPGAVPSFEEVERALSSARYKVMTVTQVDTSTGVLAPVEKLAAIAREHGALSVVDGVCATGGEVFRQTDWNVDLALTASQKALGAPPGLAVVMARPRAMEAFRARKKPVASVYADFAEWLPIMEAYEKGTNAYFATPPVNLVSALDVSLGQLLEEGMEARFERHRRMASAFRAAFRALGLSFLPQSDEITANTLSAVYYPAGVDVSLVGRVKEEGVVIAGGLHPDLKARYFRVGHMGAVSPSDVLSTVGAVARALKRCGHDGDPSAAVAAAERAFAG